MAIPAMPAQGAPWLTYAQALDTEARTIADKATAADITAAKARANHTGTQAASTITGLAAVATTGAYGDLTGTPAPVTTPDASTAAKGIVELATTAETTTGTDTDRAVTPAGLKAVADTKAALSGDNVFTGNQQVNGRLGVNASSDAKQPISLAATLTGPAVVASGSTRDKVAQAVSISVAGNFTGDTGSNVGFVWGQNVFLVTGSTAGDGAGVSTLVGSLIETAIGTPAGTTFAVVRGLEAHASFFGAAAGATVTQMESLRVSAPSRKDGATAGTATNVYGLLVEAVSGAAVGATGSAFSVFVAGGISRFGGRVDVTDTIANNGASDLQIFAGFAQADGGHLQLMKAAAGGHARFRIATANSEFQVFDGSAVTFAVTRTGLPKWTAAANAQTTVGAAGGASALPATPTKYLKVQDSAGTTYVIPAYAAA